VTVSRNLASVVLWSVISAAFIGPGTVTTAASAGALFQLDLLWAVTFSTVACIVLQEVSARLAIVTGLTMGQALTRSYGEQRGGWLKFLLGGPVILGCAAYEAGNILGGVSGLQLIIPADTRLLTIVFTIIVVIILWTDRRETIGWLMTFLVGLMGIAFIYLAIGRPFGFGAYASSSFMLSVPTGSELLVLGLIGTTIVPYNVFLGYGVSKGQTVPLMRVGLTVSVIVGGAITAAILIAGTAVAPFSSFSELSDSLRNAMGPLGPAALGLGLFAAGFSSAITSPYAASIIATSVFTWEKSRRRLVWLFVLLTGFVFGISGVRPIPVILVVQALNGLVLPLLTAFLILLINDRVLVPAAYRPSAFYNGILLLIFATVLFMGVHSVDASVASWFDLARLPYSIKAGIALVATLYLGYVLVRKKNLPA